MGNTTIIELNHDLASEIENNQKKFLEQVIDQLRSFKFKGKLIQGGKVVTAWNRGDSKIDKDWSKFKKKHGETKF